MTTRQVMMAVLLASLLSTGYTEIEEEIVKISFRAIQLVEVLRRQDTSDLEHARLFLDGSDAALLVKEDGYCFAIFDTTEPFSLTEWDKNVDSGSADICALSDETSCCTAGREYERAYSEPKYRVSLDVGIVDCHTEGYKIIIAGHGAGGAIASVAAVALMSVTNATLITFGQPPSFMGDCPVINSDNYYHWVNTHVNEERETLDYDPVPDLTLTAGASHVLLIGEDKENVVQYTKGKAHSMTSWGFDAMAHSLSRYIDRLNGYQGKGDLGTGWGKGFVCNTDAECQSGSCESCSSSYWKSGKCQ